MAAAISRFAFVLVLIAMAVVALKASHAADPGKQDALLEKLAPPPSAEALRQIPELDRKLLALRSYVRAGSGLVARWSWTDAQIRTFLASEDNKALLAEIAAVNTHFSAANPGYELYVHGTVRSLDEQLRKWNSNVSVGDAAAEILSGWRQKFGAAPETDALKPDEVRQWLKSFRLTKRANLAAPGLTSHGRALAIDFQVMKDGAIHAGANTAQIDKVWRAEGWDGKLKASIEAAGSSFSGPLTRPDEPWHYEFDPAAGEVAGDENSN